ncbi:MFS transporter [Paraburkholderia terricola]|uniref:Sugar phosphate permease n=1 Tax=Paraburkholderia terricola TaxID=169427 RepID=A0A1M6UDT9_9BURK|nr:MULTISPECIES: MFS transporter [Paraburkholderia]AXE96720.1 MFS transporter [Paraburkholderia terricola]ORC46498.1 MFS transporter [Burkholderia sp. A27]SDO90138.1 Sugar phosphate permease [Paraburkholderia sediminicola]SHK67346.1 Sugar phosphate permease [Paraburkholderia terricola]
MSNTRWTVIFLCFLANLVNYVDRANLAVAAPQIQRALGLGPTEMGLVLSGFFWTYALMQMPFGWFVDRVGARIALPLAVGWWSLFTMLTAVPTGIAGMFGCRLMLGAGEAGAYPSCVKLVSQWFEPRQRAFATAIYDSGSRVGSALSIPVVALIIGSFGWKAAFVITGALGFVWVVGWLLIYRDPSRAHRAGAVDSSVQSGAAKRRKITWRSLFTHRTLWGMMLGFFCLNFVIYFFITWFPSYLVQTHRFSLKSLGTLGMIPALVAIPSGWLGGFVSDSLVRRGWSLTAARKSCMVGGMLLSSVITLSAFTTNIYLVLAFFSVAYGSLAFAAASVLSLPNDVAPTPDHVASIGGIQNFASNLAGIVITTFTGFMVALTNGSFKVPLCVAGGSCLLGALSYLVIVGRIEPLTVGDTADTADTADAADPVATPGVGSEM